MNQFENENSNSEIRPLSSLLDMDGLCEYFEISKKTAYNLVRERDFPSFKVNGKYRIIVNDLSKWMERKAKCRK